MKRGISLVAALLVVAGAFCASALAAEYVPPPPDPAAYVPGDIAIVGGIHITKRQYSKHFRVYSHQSGVALTKQQRASAREQIVTMLISSAWYAQEAQQLGIVVTRKAVRRRFEPLKQQSFPTRRDYRQFLKSTGQTERDLLELVRHAMLRERVMENWKNSVTVNDAEVAAEYAAHPEKYATPETRDLLLVFTSSRSKARRARKALDAGTSFK